MGQAQSDQDPDNYQKPEKHRSTSKRRNTMFAGLKDTQREQLVSRGLFSSDIIQELEEYKSSDNDDLPSVQYSQLGSLERNRTVQ